MINLPPEVEPIFEEVKAKDEYGRVLSPEMEFRADELLREYCAAHEEFNLVFILHGGLRMVDRLGKYTTNQSIGCFRPESTTRNEPQIQRFYGMIEPGLPTLLIEDDACMGRALRETRQFLGERGHNSKDIFVYLEDGISCCGYQPELMGIDEAIEKADFEYEELKRKCK